MARAIDPKAKAKRQKIVAAVGGVILVLLLAWRVPPMIALMNKKPPTSGSTPVTAPTPAAPAVPGAPVSPGVPPASAGASQGDIPDSDPAPIAGPGQLVSFGRFVSKDPFVPQAGKRCVDSAGVAIMCPPVKASTGPRKPIKTPEPELQEPAADKPPAPKGARSSAQLSVNGATEGVSVNASFPTSDPVFRLVSVTATTAKVAIDGGSYASGDATITLKKDEAVTLVNTADGTRYRVVLVSTA